MQGAVFVELTKKGGFTVNKSRTVKFTVVLQKHKFGRSKSCLGQIRVSSCPSGLGALGGDIAK